MSEYDTWASVYDAWASGMPGDEAHYVPADNRIEIEREGAATIRLWWVTKSEWDGLIDVAGLEVEALYGGFGREPFDDASLEFVYVTRKP